IGIGDAQRGLRGGKRDADDRGIEGDHQLRDGDERERDPPPVGHILHGHLSKPLSPQGRGRGRGALELNSRRRAMLAAAPMAPPTTTASMAIVRFGLTVMSKPTPVTMTV